jgi:hypothetical protein
MGSIYVGGNRVKNIYVGNNKVKKVYIGQQFVWISAIANDVGMSMKTCGFTCGNGAHNPLSGGGENNWSIAFYFCWWGSKGGCLTHHNHQLREHTIVLRDDGRIEVWAARYDTNNHKVWISTKACQKGKLNGVVVTKSGHIFINGENATPSTYGGDMDFWGEFNVFPDHDIEATCLGIQGWDWTMDPSYAYVSNPLTWPYETDLSTWAMTFDNTLAYRLNGLSAAQKNIVGTPQYETWEWNEDRECLRIA